MQRINKVHRCHSHFDIIRCSTIQELEQPAIPDYVRPQRFIWFLCDVVIGCLLALAYEKPIHPTEMPSITTCTELPVDDTNKSTSDDKYPWLDPDDIRRNMTDKEIL